MIAAGCGSQSEPVDAPEEKVAANQLGGGDLDVLDFALGLERFERDFYARVLDGGVLSGAARRLAQSIYANEREHAAILADVLKFNERDASPAPRLDPRVLATTEDGILALAARLEDLGANAYSGAAATILNRKVLETALSIHSVEARHAASLHRLRGTEFVPEGAFASPLEREQVLEELGAFVL